MIPDPTPQLGDPWAVLCIPVVDPQGWELAQVHSGLAQLERLRREADAATALLVASLPDSRDAVSELSRRCRVSEREARFRRRVAHVVARLAGAAELLAAGRVSAEHLALLAPVVDRPGVGVLLERASSLSPEEFGEEVLQFRLGAEHGEDTAKRHRAQRSLRFFTRADSMVGIRGVLPALEGATLRGLLAAVADARWRREHPERARALGGHAGEPLDRRLADALLEVTGIGDDGDAAPGPAVSGRPSKPAVVVVFDVERWQARLLGNGPVPVTSSLFDQLKSELYYCFTNLAGEVLKFGRARRDPTPMQRLAVIVRDQHCVYPDCHAPPDRCEVHHLDEVVRDEGVTDVDRLGLVCKPHHRHTHLNDLVLIRGPDGSVVVRPRSAIVAEAA